MNTEIKDLLVRILAYEQENATLLMSAIANQKTQSGKYSNYIEAIAAESLAYKEAIEVRVKAISSGFLDFPIAE